MTRKPILIIVTLIILSAIILSACKATRSPADVIVEYLEALAESDQTSAVNNSCAAWEEKAIAEGNSFINVEVTLTNLECQVLEQTETEATVTCSGSFVSSYAAGEDQELDLSALNFSLIMESGEWRMCGYTR